jgi:hypothetical protein
VDIELTQTACSSSSASVTEKMTGAAIPISRPYQKLPTNPPPQRVALPIDVANSHLRQEAKPLYVIQRLSVYIQ